MMIFPPSYCPLEAASQEEQIEELPIDTDMITEEEIQENPDRLSDEEEGFSDGAPRKHHRYCALMVPLALALVFGIVMMVLVGPNILARAKGVSGGSDASADSVSATARLWEVPNASNPVSAAGACTQEDQDIITSMPSGSGEGSMGLTSYNCFNKLSIFNPAGLDNEGQINCIVEKTKMSRSCGYCYAKLSDYGALQCWQSCLNWCSEACLQCTAAHIPAFDTCLGFKSLPQIPCDGGSASDVVVRKLAADETDAKSPIAV